VGIDAELEGVLRCPLGQDVGEVEDRAAGAEENPHLAGIFQFCFIYDFIESTLDRRISRL
jgi:glutamine synthetase